MVDAPTEGIVAEFIFILDPIMVLSDMEVMFIEDPV